MATSNDIETTPEQLATLTAVAQGLTTVDHPTPVLETPQDYGLTYCDVKFKAQDGVELAAWLIPCADSDKLIICNHPATFNRYGFPGHQEPWSDFQDVQVTFGKVYKALHEAGYNVLTYDFRNHGESESAPDNNWGQGFGDEYKDVLAAFDYVKSQDTLKDMTIGLFNPCAGGNAAMHAMTKNPEYFTDVKALVCAQPASINIMSNITLAGMGLSEHKAAFAQEIEKASGFDIDKMTPHLFAPNVKIPTFLLQNKDDVWTVPDDVQTTFDLLPVADKKLHWIEDGNPKRFIGYNYFGEHPAEMIEWFDRFMKA
ncbi:alpha/beta hydrolase [Psychrobium sp. MM17-31]|uniref:alpha/beta hydrolase family protein n=1 Tax=Psychrobium sp. MM17-31 TaxID=2917758 RepID=UPI001EF56497|nr:alpha/beta hydrolase [Psychrobium sp. MM17-31]MCG7531085.1 alpha/beta hydrolase [Psychrobium sp. MM17-31]